MYKFSKLNLRKELRVLTQQEMKKLKGGVYCHCLGESGSHAANSCSDCRSICGTKGVQNCNYY